MKEEIRDPLTHEIIGAAIEVHRHLGPSLLESAYEESLSFELGLRGISFERQLALPLVYKGRKLDAGYKLDLVVAKSVLVELKCVEKLIPIHDAQVLTYLRLSGLETGLIINFHSHPLINGIKRLVLSRSAVTASLR